MNGVVAAAAAAAVPGRAASVAITGRRPSKPELKPKPDKKGRSPYFRIRPPAVSKRAGRRSVVFISSESGAEDYHDGDGIIHDADDDDGTEPPRLAIASGWQLRCRRAVVGAGNKSSSPFVVVTGQSRSQRWWDFGSTQ